jgi:hypothetical protein
MTQLSSMQQASLNGRGDSRRLANSHFRMEFGKAGIRQV